MLSTLVLFAAVAAEHAAAAPGGIARIVSDFGLNVPAFLAQVLNFSIVAFLLWRFAFKPVVATIDERQKKIADGLRHADEMKAKLADAERQHAETLKRAALEAQRIVEDARGSAKELLDRETRQTAERTQQMIAKAEETIELERRKMLNDARDEIARLVALTASRVLSRELGSDERRRYAESAARELSSV